MNKILLVLRREYFTRVRNKTFILSTILLPLFFVGFIVASAYLSLKSEDAQKVAVVDENGIFKNSFQSDHIVTYEFPQHVDADNYIEKGYTAFLKIPKHFDSGMDSISLVSDKQMSMTTEDRIRDQINDAIRNRAFLEHDIDRRVLDSINTMREDKTYKFSPVIKQGTKIEQSNAGVSYFIGFGSGILIYMTLFIYGAAVMRGVMEEKMNRIAEVIISSVRPFQLMAGKILGIAAVGITQLLIWIILIVGLVSIASFFITPEAMQSMQDTGQAMNMAAENSSAMKFFAAKESLLSANWALIIPFFLFYFLGGYLFYAALFAAVGSVVNEDPQEAQALMIPITMPIILSFIIMTAAAGNPDSTLAVWASMIPFSSPIVMMARIPSGGVPVWQLIVSILSLVGGFIITTMLAAKIYRTGILLYGKKVTFKEMGKWLLRKG